MNESSDCIIIFIGGHSLSSFFADFQLIRMFRKLFVVRVVCRGYGSAFFHVKKWGSVQAIPFPQTLSFLKVLFVLDRILPAKAGFLN